MNLISAIRGLYPELEHLRDFRIEDQGNGPEIASWDAPYPLPSEEELERGDLEAAKHEKNQEFLIHALTEFVDLMPEVKGTYQNIPRELLDQAFMAHFFFGMEGRNEPQKAQAVGALLTKFRRARAGIDSRKPSTSSAGEIRSEQWAEQ